MVSAEKPLRCAKELGQFSKLLRTSKTAFATASLPTETDNDGLADAKRFASRWCC